MSFSDVVYWIKCENSTENIGQYIRETSRRLKYGIKEHSSAIKNNYIQNSTTANHYNDCHTTINYSNKTFSINIINKSNGFLDRKIFEAYLIIFSKFNLNSNTGLYLTT